MFLSLLEKDRELLDRFSRIEERQQKLEERVAKVEEVLAEHSRLLKELAIRIEALERRYGVSTEEAFREAVKYLIEDVLKEYKVEKWIYLDKEGVVYGHESVIEADVLIKGREHILVERSDVAEIHRIGELYAREKRIRLRLLLVYWVRRRLLKSS